jgi:hypothetical protein
MRIIDDQAWAGQQSNSAVASVALLRLRDNLADVQTERAEKSAAEVGKRLCSCEPVAWVLGQIWLTEPTRIVRVRLRGQFTWSIGADEPAADTPCIRLYATACNDAGILRAPPSDISQWTLYNTTAGDTVTVELECQTANLLGPVTVLLWTRSEAGDEDVIREPGGSHVTIVDANTAGGVSGGGVQLSGLPSELSDSEYNPPERSIDFLLPYEDVPTSYEGDGARKQLGWINYDDTIAWTIPPVSTLTTGPFSAAPIFSIRTMGVLALDSAALEAAPDELGDNRRLFFSGEPITELSHVQLVSALRRLVSKRCNQLGIRPAQLPLFSQGDFAAPEIGTSYQTIAAWACHSQFASQDRTGWRAQAVIATLGNVDSLRPTTITCRLDAYSPGGSLLASGPEAGYPVRILPHPDYSAGGPWYPLSQTMHRLKTFGGWQFEGALVGLAGIWQTLVAASSWSDFGALQFVRVEIDDTDLTYPCVLRLSVRLDEALQYDTLLLGAMAGARPLL